MGRGLRGLVATGISVVGLAVIGPGAALAGTLDQQQTVTGSGFVIDSTASEAQSFTAGISGGVDQVDLYLYRVGTPTADLSVEIRDVSGGVPGSTVLASQNVPASSVPATAAFVPIFFASHAPVVAGTQYAIVAYSATASPDVFYWSGSSSNPYAGGGRFIIFGSPPPPGTWASQPTDDFAFKTYVVPPTPGPTGQRAAALKKCKKKHSHKKRKKCKKRANLLPV